MRWCRRTEFASRKGRKLGNCVRSTSPSFVRQWRLLNVRCITWICIKADLTKLIRRLKRESEKPGLYFNINNTKIMRTANWDSFEIDGEEIEVVTSFTFLGSEMEKVGRCDKEIKQRVAIGKATIIGLEKLWRDKHVSINTKKRIVRTLIFPTVLYGCETWTMTKKMEKKTNACEMWI